MKKLKIEETIGFLSGLQLEFIEAGLKEEFNHLLRVLHNNGKLEDDSYSETIYNLYYGTPSFNKHRDEKM